MNLILQSFLMKIILRLISPQSLAFDTSASRKIELREFIKGDEIYKKLKVGDIIFTATPSYIYEMTRKFVDINYDHVAVVINDNQAIHISPPLISKISPRYLTLPGSLPVVYRPNISKQSLDQFIIILYSFLGEKYSYSSVTTTLLNNLRKKAFSKLIIKHKNRFSLNDLKHNKVCTNIILYSLCRAITGLEQNLVANLSKYNYFDYGSFLPDQVLDILNCNPQFFSLIHKQDPSIDTNLGTQMMQFIENIKRTYLPPPSLEDVKEKVVEITLKLTKTPIKDIKKYTKMINLIYSLILLFRKNTMMMVRLRSLINIALLYAPKQYRLLKSLLKLRSKL